MRQQQRSRRISSEQWLRAICIGLGTFIVGMGGVLITSPPLVSFARQQGVLVPGPLTWRLGSLNVVLFVFVEIGVLSGYGVYWIIWRLVQRHGQRGG
jgi:hypothetical protein